MIISLCSSNLAINSIWPNWLKPLLERLCIYLWLYWVFLATCRSSLVAAIRGYSLVVVCGLLTVVASLAGGHRLWGAQVSVAAAHGLSSFSFWELEHRSIAVLHALSCSTACGIFPDHGWNHVSCIDRCILYHWATREAPIPLLLLLLFFISWRLIALQYCSDFCHTLTWISHGFTYVLHADPLSHLPPPPIPLGLPSAPGLITCFMHPTWASDVSPLIVYLFQCCSLWTSHPCLIPQTAKVCSVHLCLFFCFAYRVIVTIFLNSIYMC